VVLNSIKQHQMVLNDIKWCKRDKMNKDVKCCLESFCHENHGNFDLKS